MTTNPYLTARRAEYNASRAELEGLHQRAQAERRDLTEAEQTDVRTRAAQLAAIGTEIQWYEEEQQRHAAVAATSAALASGPSVERVGYGDPADDVAARADVVPSLVPPRRQVAELLRTVEAGENVRVDVAQPEVHTRAAVTTAATGLGASASGGVMLREPRRIATAVPVTVERVDGVSGLIFPVFGAGTAGIQTEGALKQEYSAVTAGQATPEVIAVWTDFSRQVAASLPSFEARLRGKHAALLARREDQLMVARLTGVPGAQTYTAPADAAYSDSLLAACGLVLSSDVAQAPDLILVNPADLPLIFPAEITQGLNGTSPDSVMRLDLHGAVVYPTSAVAAGAAIVAALGASTRYVVGMPPAVLVDAMSGLKTNTITMRMEEAVSLAIDEPTGIVRVDLNGA